MFLWLKRTVLLSMLLLTACSNSGSSSTSNQFSLAISSADPEVARYVAQTGDTATHTYDVSVTNNGPISLQPSTFNITTNNLAAPFSIVQNTCIDVTRGETCAISVTYAPQSSADYFNAQTLIFTSDSGVSQSASITGVPPTVTVTLNDYAANRTGLTVSDGGSAPFTAMLDSGSALLVVECQNLGPDAIDTGQRITVQYTTESVTGTLYYANVTLDNNSNITTSSPAPVLAVPTNSLAGFGATAIFGVKMDNQVSSKNFLEYPYNQMMIINRPQQLLTLGIIDNTTINGFAAVQLNHTPCNNYNITDTHDNFCWDDRGVPITYTIADDPNSPRIIGSIFDSGEPHTTFYVTAKPSWISYNGQGYISNPITASLIIGGQPFSIPLTTDKSLNINAHNTPERFNTGYLIFDTYQVLLDQAGGMIGIKDVI